MFAKLVGALTTEMSGEVFRLKQICPTGTVPAIFTRWLRGTWWGPKDTLVDDPYLRDLTCNPNDLCPYWNIGEIGICECEL